MRVRLKTHTVKHRNVKHLQLAIAWPAFLAAGVLEALVFAVVDPHELHWFGGAALDWSAQAIYSVSFLIFWAAISTSAAVTTLLMTESDKLNAPEIPSIGL
jgi:hypothetical protein